MTFLADLHIAAQNSRSAARGISFAQLFAAGYCKGIDLIGTGDCSNPRWLAEMRTQLLPSGDGLFRLRRSYWPKLPPVAEGNTGIRFMISGEINTVYIKGEITRKIHHLVCMPDLAEAESFAARLVPYYINDDEGSELNLDSRDLLEILLTVSPRAVLIPAHIWHHGDSLFGAKHSFANVEECYGDLAGHIFALETGFDSDPSMNRRISRLDKYALVSNSAANLPEQLGCEANIFAGEMGFSAIFSALAGKTAGFRGTLESFPQAGKYYADGHRKCQCYCSPAESRELRGRCPMCGAKMTRGVESRIAEMADRPAGKKIPGARRFERIIPLITILGELQQLPEKSKSVQQNYQRLLAELAPEMTILRHCPLDELRRVGGELFTRAIEQVRTGEVAIQPGYDGEYGTVTIFSPPERAAILQNSGNNGILSFTNSARNTASGLPGQKNLFPELPPNVSHSGLSDEQRRVVNFPRQPLLVNAGAGSGKTFIMLERMAHLINSESQPASSLLALSCCTRAAREISEQFRTRLPELADDVPLSITFQQVGLRIIAEQHSLLNLPKNIRLLSNEEADELYLRTFDSARLFPLATRQEFEELLMKALLFGDDSCPERLCALVAQLREMVPEYLLRKQREGLLDPLDALLLPISLLVEYSDIHEYYQQRWTNLLVDDYQDISRLQYLLLKLLCSPTTAITAFGDYSQSIVDFRGGDARYMRRFHEDFPGAVELFFTRNYRSCHSIVKASMQLMAGHAAAPEMWSNIPGPARIAFTKLPSAEEESEYVTQMVESLLGGSSNTTIESARAGEKERLQLGYGDIAVLYRTPQAGEELYQALTNVRIPCQRASRADAFLHPQQRQIVAFLQLAATPASPSSAEALLKAGLPGISEKAQLRLQRKLSVMNSTNKPIIDRLTAYFPKDAPLRRLQTSLKVLRTAQALSPEQCLSYAANFYEISADELAAAHWQTLYTHARQAQTLADLLATIAQEEDIDLCDPHANRVTLSTIAAAKGREWEVVLLVGCQADNFPNHAQEQAEERRIFNLAITRARRYLFLSAVMPQETAETTLSPFLQEISKELLYTRHTPCKKSTAEYTQLKMDW